jgi:hypothetical protein
MANVTCPKCKNEVDELLFKCPTCGFNLFTLKEKRSSKNKQELSEIEQYPTTTSTDDNQNTSISCTAIFFSICFPIFAIFMSWYYFRKGNLARGKIFQILSLVGIGLMIIIAVLSNR